LPQSPHVKGSSPEGVAPFIKKSFPEAVSIEKIASAPVRKSFPDKIGTASLTESQYCPSRPLRRMAHSQFSAPESYLKE